MARPAPSVGFALPTSTPIRERGRRNSTLPPPMLVTLDRHLRDVSGASPELVAVLEALECSFREVSLLLRHGLRTGGDAKHGSGVWQREVLKLDQKVAEIILAALRGTRTRVVALGTHEGVVELEGESSGNGIGLDAAPPAPAPAVSADPYDYYCAPTSPATSPCVRRFAVVVDPLGGDAEKADAGASSGTIFSVYSARAGGEEGGTRASVLRRGEEMLAAGYVVFGAATQLVLSVGRGVDGFTLHPSLGCFTLTRPQLRMPHTGRFYSVNLGHRRQWSEAMALHVDLVSQSKSLRYTGTFVADVHRTLLYGGVFFYPASSRRPRGKLRLLFQAAPVAFLMEQAGGGSACGAQRTLEIEPGTLNQCVPVAFGSRSDVDAYVRSSAVHESG